MRTLYIVFLVSISFSAFSQNDSIPYNLFKNKIIVYGSLGYYDAPFKIQHTFSPTVNQLNYLPNTNPILGVGVIYNWFGASANFQLPGHVRNPSKYGKSTYFDFDLSFQLEQLYFRGDFHRYRGYALANYNEFSSKSETKLNNSLRTYSTSINAYYLLNEDYNMYAAKGIEGMYQKLATTLYLKGTFNIHGITQPGNPIIPYTYFDNIRDVWKSRRISAVDVGLIPGIALSNKIKQLHFSFMAGIGGVIQAKTYRFSTTFRGFVGLAPRYDLNFNIGYNEDTWFLQLKTDIDYKSISFNQLQYSQNYYYIRLEYGYRF